MAISILRFTNIILAALLAGVSFGIRIGYNPSQLSPSTYLEQQQHTILSLKTLMISLVVAATLVTLVSAFLQKANRGIFWSLIVAALCFIVCIVITKFGNVQIDDIVMAWKPDSMPSNWTVLRDQWWSFHTMRTIVELIALVIITWVSIRKGSFVAVEKN